jgi:hypothetical protein
LCFDWIYCNSNCLKAQQECIVVKSGWFDAFQRQNLPFFVGVSDQFSYRPSLLNAPDLPPWIHYVYSDRHQTGFLYGVPPLQHGDVEVSGA